METFLIILIAFLSYLCGRMQNYQKWRVAGRMYAATRKTYYDNNNLRLENAILKQELNKLDNIKVKQP